MKIVAVSLLSFILFLGLPPAVRAQLAFPPEQPRVFLDTAYVPPASGVVRVVNSGDNLQSVINVANPGDIISLQAGATFTGNFTLPNKTGTADIYIRSSAPDSSLPAPGVRMNPSFAGSLPKIVTSNSAPAMMTTNNAHNYRFVGIEFAVASNVVTNYGIVVLGDSGSAQNTLGVVPQNIVLDRCYIHGNATGNISRGVALNSASTAIIDSYISSIHGEGFDTQAICCWNGPGPFKITNNYLEAAGENVLFGGADPSIPNLVPADIEFRRNYSSKPLSWCPSDPTFNGIGGNLSRHWLVKNVFELKNARRLLIDGNIFENCWVDGQVGYAIVLTPRNQDGTAPWSAVQDITFTNNTIRHAAAGVNILGYDDIHTSQQTQRLLLKNNLFDDIGPAVLGVSGRLIQITNGTTDLLIDHNTGIQTGNVVTADALSNTRFSYTNNIAPHNLYGVIGTGTGIGTPTLQTYFPGYTFGDNVLAGGTSTQYPPTNFFPASLSNVGFVDLAGHNYRLSTTSPYRNAGTDGTDLGANIDAMLAAQSSPAPAGIDTLGMYVPTTAATFLRNSNTPGPADVVFSFGSGGTLVPLRGDWDADGDDTPGLYSPDTGAFFLKNANSGGAADTVFSFGAGNAGFVPLVGDWNGDGVDTVGLYVPSTGAFFLKNTNISGPADIVFTFGAGNSGVVPITGDWNGDGIDTIGIYQPSNGFFFLTNTNASGPASLTFGFGPGGQGWKPIAGDFDGNGTDSIGVYSPTTSAFFLGNTNSGGPAAITVNYGPSGATPLVGDWDGR